MNASNQIVINAVTTTICFLAVATVVSVCLLSYKSIEIPPELNTLAGGLVGAITAMLVKTSATSSAPTQTEIVNPPSSPVNTTDVKP